ncbi:MAG: septation regulator SpoVG [Bacillota bacterium]
MFVTDVRIRSINQEGKMKAIVSITLNDMFAIHDLRIIEGRNGLFVAMPSKRNPNGEFKDIAHPINSKTREMIQETVISAYTAALKQKAVTV